MILNFKNSMIPHQCGYIPFGGNANWLLFNGKAKNRKKNKFNNHIKTLYFMNN